MKKRIDEKGAGKYRQSFSIDIFGKSDAHVHVRQYDFEIILQQIWERHCFLHHSL